MISHKYTLICDDVRREDNGKFLILGLYTPDISVPQIPFVLSTLTFFQLLESDRPGQWNMRFRLQHLETGRIVIEGMGPAIFPKPGLGISPLKFANLQFNAAGDYNFSIEIQDQREPIIVGFTVILNIPQQPQSQGFR